jgi:TM2 domain-containing membrane protein YozV
MDSQKVDMFILANAKYFESHQVAHIRDTLINADESKWASVSTLQFKDPLMMQVISIIGGALGIDRFVLGDTGMGVGKLLTCGGFHVWTIIDWFMIQGATREKNMMSLQQVLY